MDANALQTELADHGVVGVMTTVVTHGGSTVAKAFPLTRLAAVAEVGVGLSPVSDAFGADGGIDPGQSLARPDGDERLVPDLAALRLLGGAPGWAWAPSDRRTMSGGPVALDQRDFARRTVTALAERGVRARAGFELEWSCGTAGPDGSFVPAAAGGPYSAARVLDAGDYGRDLLHSFATAGVEIQQFHAEYSPGQFEVSLPTTDPVSAADQMVLAKLIVQAVSRRHGARASFSPAVAADGVGNGGHVHVSFHRDTGPLLGGGSGPGGLTDDGAAILAGLVAAAPAMLAVGCPLAASYLRLRPSRWAGASQIWGIENREAPIRLIPAGNAPEAANVEWKSPDPAGNPYLVVGTVLAVAEAALASPQPLPEPVVGDPVGRPDVVPLPGDLDAAVAAFRRDRTLAAAMGPDLHRTLAEQREAEIRATAGWDAERIAARTRWWPEPAPAP